MHVVVAGATGGTGREIVRELIERGIPTRALVRDRDAAKRILPAAVELVVVDVLDAAGVREAIAGSTVLLCATGARPSLNPLGPLQVDYWGTRNLVDAAKACDIEHFAIVSSLCVSQFFHPLNLFWLVLFWKRQAEQYLVDSGVSYTIVRPGGLKNDDNSDPLVMSSADSLFGGSIPRTRVAQVCVEALFQPAARNKIVEIVTDDKATMQDWAQLFAGVA
ncbi:NmrA-like family [Rubidibacter lacunae KORDI 51-2]|uniref:NmrA-like family n=1 Tax=Rubidibacter lacunae KORDI 51-2 TaxID=582515 RepID=U5DDL6_9CHRO|nr:NAD(P)H-binding protein [Rubidibacter lacunae]ERN42588.1 NmrA-like family [Rubidibacter lacunae KORDI 51-2]